MSHENKVDRTNRFSLRKLRRWFGKSIDHLLQVRFRFWKAEKPQDNYSAGLLQSARRYLIKSLGLKRSFDVAAFRPGSSADAGIPARRLLNPWYWCKWSVSFTVDWILSRPYSAIIAACPAIALGIALLVAVAFSATDRSQLRESRYRALFDDSVKQQDFEVAAVVLKSLIDCNPDNLDLQYRQALLDQMRGNSPAAAKRMDELATSKDHGLAAMWIIAQEFNLQELKKWSANDHSRFRELMEIGLSNLTGENLLSTKVLMFSYLAEIGAYSDAERYLAEVIPARPELALAAASLCRSQHDATGVSKYAAIAQRHFESKLSRKPSDILSRIDLARVLMLQSKFEDAAKLLNDGYRLTKDGRLASVTGEALVMWSNHLANADMSSKSLVKRLQILHAAVGVAPSDPLVGSSIAQLLIDCRENGAPEVVALRKAILEGADPVSNHFIRGTLALLDGRTAEAKTQLELALEREPNAPAILNNLAIALADNNDDELEKALSLVNTAIEKLPNHSYFLETRGQIHLKLAHWQAAIVDLEQALATQELRPAIYPSLAAAYEKTGAKDMTELYRRLANETRPD